MIHRFSTARRRSSPGFTLLEVLVAAAILGIVILLSAGHVSGALKRSQDIRARTTVLEVEQGFRHDLLTAVNGFYSAACRHPSITFWSFLAGALAPTGVVMDQITAPLEASILASAPNLTISRTLKPVLDRCVATAIPDFRFRGDGGFCARLRLVPTPPGAQPAVLAVSSTGSLFANQPVIGEFYFSNLNAVTGTPLRCVALPLATPINTNPFAGKTFAELINSYGPPDPNCGLFYRSFIDDPNFRAKVLAQVQTALAGGVPGTYAQWAAALEDACRPYTGGNVNFLGVPALTVPVVPPNQAPYATLYYTIHYVEAALSGKPFYRSFSGVLNTGNDSLRINP